MKSTFTATVPILNLSHQPDSSGLILPPEAYVTYDKTIPVTYGKDELETDIGKAVIFKQNNQFLANMFLTSTHKDMIKSERLIRKLYPAVELEIFEQIGQAIFKCEIIGLFLTTYKNYDSKIKPLGDFLVKTVERVH